MDSVRRGQMKGTTTKAGTEIGEGIVTRASTQKGTRTRTGI